VSTNPDQPQELPLFLLDSVMFPGGRLALRVFETRYMDMIKDCLRNQTPFGICLIAQGSELLDAQAPDPAHGAAQPHAVGCLARIADWDMPQLGILNIVVHGGQRFQILAQHTRANGLVVAQVAYQEEPPVAPIPGDYARLVPMLRALLEALEEEAPPAPHRFYDAAWVACRWAEILPLPLLARQQILELNDGVARLEAIYRFLEKESSSLT
jgi:Lon protease-like protein